MSDTPKSVPIKNISLSPSVEYDEDDQPLPPPTPLTPERITQLYVVPTQPHSVDLSPTVDLSSPHIVDSSPNTVNWYPPNSADEDNPSWFPPSNTTWSEPSL